MSEKAKRTVFGKIMIGVGLAVSVLFLAFLLLFCFDTIPFEFVGLLLFGWISYLGRVFPQMTFNPEIAIDAVVAFGLAVFGLHRVLSWWVKQTKDGSERWRFAWTMKISAMVLLLFGTSIAAVGIVHQIAWLCREGKWIELSGRGKQTFELMNLKQVGTAAKLYAMDHQERFPKTLEELVPDYLGDRELLFTRAMDGEPPQMVEYFPGYGERDDAGIVIVASPRPMEGPKGRKRAVIYTDISGVVIPEAQFQEAIQKQRAAKRGR